MNPESHTHQRNPFGARSVLPTSSGPLIFYSLPALARETGIQLDRLPYSIRVLLENLLRSCDGSERICDPEGVVRLANWATAPAHDAEIPFMPARVVLQDFTGVPALVDLAAMRSAVARKGGNPERINPLVPVDLVIDHSVQVDYFGTPDALGLNAKKEFERNRERYEFLRWGQKAFRNFRVVPPATGIVHQVNLEYLAQGVLTKTQNGEGVAYPDTVLGTDSHTTMINGLGVLGWGVGGIEAEAVMLGQPYSLLTPRVVGVRLTGSLRDGATATDLVLTLTEILRAHGVVDQFVEYFGPGVSTLSLPDRATVANMAPEYGATMGFFPVDAETVDYYRRTGRPPDLVDLIDRYHREQGLFRSDSSPEPVYSTVLTLALDDVEPSLAGPRRPQDRVPLRDAKTAFRKALADFIASRASRAPRPLAEVSRWSGEGGVTAVAEPAPPVTTDSPEVSIQVNGERTTLTHGSVVIAAITSCTNTSNPTVMIGAGILARKAVARGLRVPPYVKTSLAPGSRVVTEYLRETGLLQALEAIRFHIVGYGCTTCIGNSGPLPEAVDRAIRENDLIVAAVLSGNRNFEGRIHPRVRANYLASPILVVAYALAGTMDIDLQSEPLGTGYDGTPVFFRDIAPTTDEITAELRHAMNPHLFQKYYSDVFEGPEEWRALAVPEGEIYAWNDDSTYVREPPYFAEMTDEPLPPQDIRGARALAILGDSVTTDHISPAGNIPLDSPAGRYLVDRGVAPADFNSYGSRRGNHEVMIRGTFANIRLKNRLADGKEGGWTRHFPSGDLLPIYDAALRYKQDGVPLLILAGKEYGTGSSRDWAAKGTLLLGVRAVIAQSFERIHRSNLIGMGVLPLQFAEGQSAESLGLTGREVFTITGISEGLTPLKSLTVTATREDGSVLSFAVTARLHSAMEIDYYRHGGILPFVLRRLLRTEAGMGT
jgi:aconitate hydratase